MSEIYINMASMMLKATLEDEFADLLFNRETRLDAVRDYERKNDVEIPQEQIDMLLAIKAQNIEDLLIKYIIEMEKEDG